MPFPSLASPSEISDELLSAYIDGQLAAADRRRVEQALEADARVRARLQALQMTISLLKQAPPAPVPRAFTLSENMVLAAGGTVRGVEQTGLLARLFGPLTRAMPLATAAVAVALLVVVGVDVWPQTATLPQAAAPPQAMMEAAVEAPAAEPEVAEAPAAESMVTEKVVVVTVAVEKESEAAREAPVAVEAPAADVAEVPAEEMMAIEAPAPVSKSMVESEQPEGLRAMGGGEEPARMESSSLLTDTEPAEAEPVAVAAQPETSGAPEPTSSPPLEPARNTLRTVEYLLAGLLGLLLAATWWVRRQAAG